MPLVDLALILIIVGFALAGAYFGFVRTLEGFLGSIIAMVIANILIAPISTALSDVFGGGAGLTIIIFIVVFLIVMKTLSLLFWVIEKATGFIKLVPFAKSVNRILGALLGFLEGIIVVGVILFFGVVYLPDAVVGKWAEMSVVAGFLVEAMSIIQNLFPDAIRITIDNK